MGFSDPRKIVKELSLAEGARVADFGAGSGHYTFAAARKVGSEGRVYAVEIQKEVLDRLKSDAQREGLDNIDIVWGDVDERGGSKLAPTSVDAVILANVLFQTEHRRATAEEVMRVLKPKGKVLVVDWTDSFEGLGPRTQDLCKKEGARELFEDIGFVFEKEVSDAGDHHYGFIFMKN